MRFYDRFKTGRNARPMSAKPAVLILTTLALGACDVVNPGPVRDEFLNLPASHEALVTGAERMLVESLNRVAYSGGVVAREIFPGGETTGGLTARQQGGQLPDDEVDIHWDNTQRARFIAEDAIYRFTQVATTYEPATLAQAYIWAGFANRVLGENWCQVVFNGGPAQPYTDALTRAEQHFTDALAIATTDTQRWSARAGRAQIRLWLEDWAGAAADAAEVPTDFVLVVDADGADVDSRNHIYWSNANLPYRQFTMHFTYYYQYYLDTRDPRIAWLEYPSQPVANASLQGYGQVPWSQNRKYTDVGTDYRVASGREMRLVEAEVLLRAGDWPEAMDLVNDVRTAVMRDDNGAALDPWTVTSLDEAWTAYMRERAIETHLEARRLGDLRRFEGQVPGDIELADFEAQSVIFSQAPRAQCFPIPETERNTNPNIS